jgi:hypothetical protein
MICIFTTWHAITATNHIYVHIDCCTQGLQDRCFVSYRGGTATFTKAYVDMPALLSSDHIHTAGYYNMPAMAKDLPGILKQARAAGATTSFTPQVSYVCNACSCVKISATCLILTTTTENGKGEAVEV